MKPAPLITLTAAERSQLERWARAHVAPARLVRRAQIVLFAAQGLTNKEIAGRVRQSEHAVGRWRRRCAQDRCAGIESEARRTGRPATLRQQTARRIIEATTRTQPEGATHWSTRTLAAHPGLNREPVRRVWKEAGLKPHLVRTFKLSRDPQFADKVIDVAGLYLNPPEHALVLCVHEKSQIQAPDRTQPGLPLKKGRCGTLTHDYKRNGTTTLFAALNVLDGKVIGTCQPRHRHREWLAFLRLLERRTPRQYDLHLVLDNYPSVFS